MDVVLLRWPLEADRRDDLTAAGTPRLLLLEDGAPPPDPADCLEDWLRVPATEDDVRARVGGLGQRASAHHQVGPPELDEFGMLRYAGRWVTLPPVEARLASA